MKLEVNPFIIRQYYPKQNIPFKSVGLYFCKKNELLGFVQLRFVQFTITSFYESALYHRNTKSMCQPQDFTKSDTISSLYVCVCVCALMLCLKSEVNCTLLVVQGGSVCVCVCVCVCVHVHVCVGEREASFVEKRR